MISIILFYGMPWKLWIKLALYLLQKIDMLGNLYQQNKTILMIIIKRPQKMRGLFLSQSLKKPPNFMIEFSKISNSGLIYKIKSAAKFLVISEN
ncbi:hypothetical protein ASE00_04225 [Sphingomonas sp. Root710]|nr:hypothetical protein ASE00_04225 [Sphingomonas sp. Root710]